MKTTDFSYNLPPERIAQSPADPRDSSRLLVLDRASGKITHTVFREIGRFLRKGDLLVVNDSKVFKARLHATVGAGLSRPGFVDHRGGRDKPAPTTIEIFLLRPDGNHWLALAKPGRKIKSGNILNFQDGQTAIVKEKRDDGTVVLDFEKSTDEIFAWTDRIGEVPLPPYINQKLSTEHCELRTSAYQTVYANPRGSVAAPTAGFHFTTELIEKLKANGISFATVTLHVGLGTFRPMKTDDVEDHVMHEEWICVPDVARSMLRDAKQRGSRVIAVGTTTVRSLESEISHGFTNIFIKPGYKFKNIDALVTNFHLPKSTLLVLVSAFAGRDLIIKAYTEAIENSYRFYSFGDAMLIL